MLLFAILSGMALGAGTGATVSTAVVTVFGVATAKAGTAIAVGTLAGAGIGGIAGGADHIGREEY